MVSNVVLMRSDMENKDYMNVFNGEQVMLNNEPRGPYQRKTKRGFPLLKPDDRRPYLGILWLERTRGYQEQAKMCLKRSKIRWPIINVAFFLFYILSILIRWTN